MLYDTNNLIFLFFYKNSFIDKGNPILSLVKSIPNMMLALEDEMETEKARNTIRKPEFGNSFILE